MSDTWQPEQRPIAPELSDDYQARHYGDITRFPTIADKLDAATINQLFEIARGGLGEPATWRDTELGGE
jgi:hypothetical protein